MRQLDRLPRNARSALMRAERHAKILDAAIQESLAVGFRNFTRRNVAARAGVAVGSVNHAFGTIDALREAVLKTAVSRELTPIIRQGLADEHPIAQSAPPGLKQLALQEALAG